MIRQRVRIRFRKEGDLRFISHRDLVRVIERMFRRAGLPLSMSEGFHPKARMSFPSALSLGICGTDEVMEFELSKEMQAEPLLARLQAVAPPGLGIVNLRLLGSGDGKGHVERLTYEFPLPASRRDHVQRAIHRLMAAPSFLVDRAGQSEPVDLRASLESVDLDERVVRFRVRATPTASARPREILDVLGLSDLETEGLFLTRTRVEISQ